MKTMEKLLEVPGAANVFAAKLVGRVIDQVARGFGDDETLEDAVSLFKAFEKRYPKDTISLVDMFKKIRKNASTDTNDGLTEQIEELSPEYQAIWKSEGVESERDALDAAMPRLTELLLTTQPDINAWENLPIVAQWSLLRYSEEALTKRIAVWTGYAETDRKAGKTNTNAIRLEQMYKDAVEPLFDIVSEFLEDEVVQDHLEQCRMAGMNIPDRAVG